MPNPSSLKEIKAALETSSPWAPWLLDPFAGLQDSYTPTPVLCNFEGLRKYFHFKVQKDVLGLTSDYLTVQKDF